MDVVIITSCRPSQVEYWRKRVENSLKAVHAKNVLVLGIYEDWRHGAGNGFGTLFAFREAQAQAKSDYGRDLMEELIAGASIAIYHTAGQGKRLSPLTSVEGNNKPAVKLPCAYNNSPMTILDAVIKQSFMLSPHRKGRLSVFWADQLYLPEHDALPPSADITVVCQKIVLGTHQDWEDNRLGQYGLIARDENGKYQHLDKIDYKTANQQNWKEVAVSLGSFTLSPKILKALLHEYQSELDRKNETMDVEPQLFMPLTLQEDLYMELMEKRGVSREKAAHHYLRIRHFLDDYGDVKYSVEDIGLKGHWWDFGTLESYYSALLTLCKGPKDPLYEFLYNDTSRRLQIQQSGDSLLINCKIGRCHAKNSVLFGVQAEEVDLSDGIALNVFAPSISAHKALIYNAVSDIPLELPGYGVRADVFIPGNNRHIVMHTNLKRDGKHDWNNKINGNEWTYAELEKLTSAMDLQASDKLRRECISTIANARRIITS